MAFVNVPIDRQSISDQESGKFVMAITHLHSYLVHPGKGVPEKERPQIRGTTIPLSGQLHLMMKRVYERSDRECKIAIAFNSSSQQNPARDLITKYADSPRLNTGRKIAQRLQEFTDGKSKMGLLFLACGQEKKKLRVLISRFPADVGILAEEEKGKLTVEFLEKVFMKNVTAYKAALYEGTSTSAGFWDGKVVDRQIVDGIVRSVSDYWVKGFLESDCRTTSAFGTKRLATLLKNCVRKAGDVKTKEELVSVARLAPNMGGQTVSIASVAHQLSLSPTSQQLLRDEVRSDTLFNESFVLDSTVFADALTYQSLELDNGGILTAEAAKFPQVFTEDIVDASKEIRRYTTQGVVIDRGLGGSKQ